jgi:hypothetical protein
MASLAIVAAVLALWATLYASLPRYPPALGLPLTAVAMLFLTALTLIRRRHRADWPGLAQFGFVVSAVGLALWIVGGLLNALDITTAEFMARPEGGWGLFSAGLIPIGVTAIRRKWPMALWLLLPLGVLFISGELIKLRLGERAGGLTVFVAFGLLWLIVALMLNRAPGRTPPGGPER